MSRPRSNRALTQAIWSKILIRVLRNASASSTREPRSARTPRIERSGEPHHEDRATACSRSESTSGMSVRMMWDPCRPRSRSSEGNPIEAELSEPRLELWSRIERFPTAMRPSAFLWPSSGLGKGVAARLDARRRHLTSRERSAQRRVLLPTSPRPSSSTVARSEPLRRRAAIDPTMAMAAPAAAT